MMKLFLIISSLLSVTFAQHQPSVTCDFRYSGGTTYFCYLRIHNPDNFNNFTEIGGAHVDGYTNNDVTGVSCIDENTDSTILPAIICDSFPNLQSLTFRNTTVAEIDDIALRNCSNLIEFQFSSNRITSIKANAFVNLREALYIDFSYNSIVNLPENVFAGQQNLLILAMRYIGLAIIPTDLFRPLTNLRFLRLDGNYLTELPATVFGNNSYLETLYLPSNRLETLDRKSFGTLTQLENLYVERNRINALDREIFDDARSLHFFHFDENLCASVQFNFFGLYREANLRMLETCFSNFDHQLDTITTEGDADYKLFSAPESGMAIRVRADKEIQIVFLENNAVQKPMFEIFIGTANNTQSLSQLSLLDNVITLTVPTMDIITRNPWNDFVVTWENSNILVFQGSVVNPPFMNFTMQNDLFEFNYFGLRSVETRALWSIQPSQ